MEGERPADVVKGGPEVRGGVLTLIGGGGGN